MNSDKPIRVNPSASKPATTCCDLRLTRRQHRPSQVEIIDRLLLKPGLRRRVNAHCVSCIYDDQVPGSWRKQVELCTVESCPLFEDRPQTLKIRARRPDTPVISSRVDETQSIDTATLEVRLLSDDF
jgi:hypothetical protein